MIKSPDWVDLFLERIDQINDRIQSHSVEFRQALHILNIKVDSLGSNQHMNKEELLHKIHEGELAQAKANGKLGIKIAGLSGTVAIIVTIVLSLIKGKIGG